MANVSLSIAAFCHAKNLTELETWFRDIIILEWEQGKLDKYVGILKIKKKCNKNGGSSSLITSKFVRDILL